MSPRKIKFGVTIPQFGASWAEAKEIALASVKFAEESPDPPLEKLYDYTYAMEPARPRAEGKNDGDTDRPEGGPAPKKEKARA